MSEPHNAGQTIIVPQVSPMRAPATDVDWGSIIITENWGRLFIKKGDQEIIVHQRFYEDLATAISHFIAPVSIEQNDR